MSIKSSFYFVFDGIESHRMGVANVTVGRSGMQEETLLGGREILTRQIRGKTETFLYDIKYSPIKIPVQLAFTDTFTDEQIRAVSRWLDQKTYKELWFSANPNRRFFAIVEGDTTLNHNALNQGYIDLTFITNDYYAYSPEYVEDIDFSYLNDSGDEFKLNNYGDVDIKPEIQIYKINDGDVKIINYSNRGEEFAFTGLKDSETVYINNQREEIITDIPDITRYDNHNETFFNLVRGTNHLKIYGKCKIIFRYRCKFSQGQILNGGDSTCPYTY